MSSGQLNLFTTASTTTLVTCSRHRNLQNIQIRILQIFVLIFLMILQQTIWGLLEKNQDLEKVAWFWSNLPYQAKKSKQKIWRIQIGIFWRFRCFEQVIYHAFKKKLSTDYLFEDQVTSEGLEGFQSCAPMMGWVQQWVELVIY